MTQEWTNALNDHPLPWLVEEHARNPELRILSLADLLDEQGQATNPKISLPSGRPVAALSVEFNLQPTLEKENHEATF
jgi:hypothetical protein